MVAGKYEHEHGDVTVVDDCCQPAPLTPLVTNCASCGSPDVVFESPAEGYWCRGCGASA